MKKSMKRIVVEGFLPVALIGIWIAWSASSGSPYFPPLTDVLRAFNDTWIFERATSDLWPSLRNMSIGLTIAAVLGVAIGVPLGMFDTFRRAAEPIIEFVRAIPPPALIPFGMVILGPTAGMRISLIALVCLFPILLNTVDGVRGLDHTVKETCRSFKISRALYMRSVLLPAAMPQIMAGLRTAVSLALIMVVVSEMVASTEGVGYFVLQSQRSFAITEMWTGIVLLGAIGYLLNLLFVAVERRVLFWHRSSHGHHD